MADFGKTTVGGTSRSLAVDSKRFCKFTSPSDIGDLDSISAYLNRSGTGSGYAVRGGIYTDSSGSPNALVANSAIEISSNIARNTPQWYTVNYVTKPSLSPSTVYWLGVQFAKAGLTYDDVGATDQQKDGSDAYSDGLANPFGSTSNPLAREMSVYVSYTAGQTFFQTIAATAVGVATLSKQMTYLKTMAATAVGVASLATAKLFVQTLAAIATGAAALSKVSTYTQTLAAVAVGVSTLSRLATYSRTLAAAAIGAASISRVATYSRILTATAVGVAALTTTKLFQRTLSAAAVGVGTLSRAAIYVETLSAQAVGLATLSRLVTFSQTLAATAVGAATLATGFIEGAVAKSNNLIRHLLRRRP